MHTRSYWSEISSLITDFTCFKNTPPAVRVFSSLTRSNGSQRPITFPKQENKENYSRRSNKNLTGQWGNSNWNSLFSIEILRCPTIGDEDVRGLKGGAAWTYVGKQGAALICVTSLYLCGFFPSHRHSWRWLLCQKQGRHAYILGINFQNLKLLQGSLSCKKHDPLTIKSKTRTVNPD